MVGALRDLSEIARKGGTIEVRCKSCGHACMFAPAELASWLTSRRKDTGWRNFGRYLKCSGCGQYGPTPSWTPLDPPPVLPSANGEKPLRAMRPRAITPDEFQRFRKATR